MYGDAPVTVSASIVATAFDILDGVAGKLLGNVDKVYVNVVGSIIDCTIVEILY